MAGDGAGGVEVYGQKGSVGVVVVHEEFGRDDYVRSVARALAAAGYPAATIDLYDGRHAGTLDEARALRGGLTDDAVLARFDDARAAIGRRLVPHARVGTLGFGMGGGYALLAGCRRPFDFVVDYGGRIERAEDVDGLSGPVLLLLASEDDRITPWAFSELLPASRVARKRVSVELYAGVRPAFHRPGGEGHDAASADAAWRRTLAFLNDVRASAITVK
jgi:carboxymethylenebutenolidase